jgi:penicillin-binding protein 2
MTEFKHHAVELQHFRRRLWLLAGLIGVCFTVLLGRMLWLQVIRRSDYAAQADSNRIALLPLAPQRGLILDRHGIALARNVPVYTLEVTPSHLGASLDAVLDKLASVIPISARERRRFRQLAAESPGFASLPLLSGMDDTDVARFAVNGFRFPGVAMHARLHRQYPHGELAAHALGYIGRINQKDLVAIASAGASANYKGTDHIGKSGLEQSYETLLHGATGYEQVEVTASGRAVRTLSRVAPVAGKNLVLSLDLGLQQVAEQAFGNHRGALVAIDPHSGEVLAYVSKPGYDPNLFVDGIDQENWDALNTSIDRPLLNRPLSGTYAPGSTFKPFMALAALELGVRTPSQSYDDPGYLMVGQHKFRDDFYHGVVNLHKSIVVSCNTYYYRLGTEMAIDTIHAFMQQFGFGQPTGIDLAHESEGVLPSTAWKRGQFKDAKAGKWYVGDTVSVSNGSGYNAYTPLQIAEAVATLANDGVAVRPHLLHAPAGATRRIALQQKNIDLVKQAMVGVTSETDGTARSAFDGADYSVGGKTGTAQVVGIRKNAKYDAAALAERLRDNGLFTAFAPAAQPRIALAVIVENSGWGGAVAAPIARAALDYYLHEKPDVSMPGNPAPATRLSAVSAAARPGA